MRTKSLLIGLCMGMPMLAQEVLTDVRAPQSPASTLLGVQAGSISRPKSWKEFEASLYSNFLNGNSFAVPNDFALEFAPWWSGKKKAMTPERYLIPKNQWETVKRNFALSLASTQNFAISDSLKTNALAFGVRSMLVFSSSARNERIKKSLDGTVDKLALTTALNRIATATAHRLGCPICDQADFFKEFKKDIIADSLIGDERPRGSDLDAFIFHVQRSVLKIDADADNLSDLIQSFYELDKGVERLHEVSKVNQSFKVEGAAGMLVGFPTNENDYSFIPKAGVWVTPSYEPGDGHWEILGVARYLFYKSDFYERFGGASGLFDNNVDLGVRLVYKRGPVSLEAEYTSRSSTVKLSEVQDETTGIVVTTTKKESDYQYIVNLNYQVNPDLILSYNFGKQLEGTFKVNGDVVSLLTLNLGFGGPSTQAGSKMVQN